MQNDSFIGYLNSHDVHDATVNRVHQEGQRLQVLINTVDGRLVRFEFSDVQSLKMHRAEGMVLYSLSEMQHPPPYRKFVFTNSDESGDAYLEVVAGEINKALE